MADIPESIGRRFDKGWTKEMIPWDERSLFVKITTWLHPPIVIIALLALLTCHHGEEVEASAMS